MTRFLIEYHNGLNPTTEEIYYASDWAERREIEREWQDWFSGDELREQTTGAQDENGEKQLRYPLVINSAKVYCEIHGDIMFGMPQSYDEPPVRMAFISKTTRPKRCHPSSTGLPTIRI